MPVTATPMMREAARVDQMLRTRSTAHSAAVPAAMEMTIDSATSGMLYFIMSGMTIAAMPR
jgi:hypothetical protein